MLVSKEEKIAFVAHGFADDYITPWWEPVNQNLQDLGYNVEQIHFDGFLKTVDSPVKYADDVGETLENKLKEINYEPEEVLVLGHSMGGIVVRYAVEELGYGEETDIIVTFGSPHQGTKVAEPFTWMFDGARDMRYGSEFLHELNDNGVSEDIEYINFYASDDPLFFDYKNAEIPVDAENVENVQLGTPNHELFAEKLSETAELGFKIMYDMCEDLQKIALDAAFRPWVFTSPSYAAEFVDTKRVNKRLEELEELVQTNPEDFFTGHVTMFCDRDTWRKVSEHLEPETTQ